MRPYTAGYARGYMTLLNAAGCQQTWTAADEDGLVDAATEDPWNEDLWYREVKAEAQGAVDDFLDRHRQESP